MKFQDESMKTFNKFDPRDRSLGRTRYFSMTNTLWTMRIILVNWTDYELRRMQHKWWFLSDIIDIWHWEWLVMNQNFSIRVANLEFKKVSLTHSLRISYWSKWQFLRYHCFCTPLIWNSCDVQNQNTAL